MDTLRLTLIILAGYMEASGMKGLNDYLSRVCVAIWCRLAVADDTCTNSRMHEHLQSYFKKDRRLRWEFPVELCFSILGRKRDLSHDPYENAVSCAWSR